jgi:hypothetical protein
MGNLVSKNKDAVVVTSPTKQQSQPQSTVSDVEHTRSQPPKQPPQQHQSLAQPDNEPPGFIADSSTSLENSLNNALASIPAPAVAEAQPSVASPVATNNTDPVKKDRTSPPVTQKQSFFPDSKQRGAASRANSAGGHRTETNNSSNEYRKHRFGSEPNVRQDGRRAKVLYDSH